MTKKCKICEKELLVSDFYTINKKGKIYLMNKCKECHKNIFKIKRNKITKEELKERLSKRMKQFWLENPDKHPWKKNSKFKSKPCENFKYVLKNMDIFFIEEFTPSNEKLYSIDIALPDKKIAIEVNGNQHYEKDGNLKDYYKKRHEFIKSMGWTIYELHYSLCFDDKTIQKIINNILNNSKYIYDFDYKDYLFKKLNKPKRKKLYSICICGNKMSKTSKRCRTCSSLSQRKSERPDISTIKEDIENMGYVKTGKKYGVSDNTIRKWVSGMSGDRTHE